jgi:hypothetical protein
MYTKFKEDNPATEITAKKNANESISKMTELATGLRDYAKIWQIPGKEEVYE